MLFLIPVLVTMALMAGVWAFVCLPLFPWEEEIYGSKKERVKSAAEGDEKENEEDKNKDEIEYCIVPALKELYPRVEFTTEKGKRMAYELLVKGHEDKNVDPNTLFEYLMLRVHLGEAFVGIGTGVVEKTNAMVVTMGTDGLTPKELYLPRLPVIDLRDYLDLGMTMDVSRVMQAWGWFSSPNKVTFIFLGSTPYMIAGAWGLAEAFVTHFILTSEESKLHLVVSFSCEEDNKPMIPRYLVTSKEPGIIHCTVTSSLIDWDAFAQKINVQGKLVTLDPFAQ